jgi:aspartyl-tRNA(Asn)/glutamyl-tRNA(Gln) amidotransferase subunit B
MKNYQITMGLEIHTQLNTTHKVFSNSLNIYSSTPNEYTNEVDLALPGTLPFLNIEVVKKAIVLGKAMNMELNPILAFNRKVYFHYDLPKGYQITQFGDNVIAKNGIVKLNNGKEIAINEFHIEEDTAKQIQNGNNNFLDYNRCGSPLIEIVTHPVFHTKEEVIEFLTKLKRILVFLNISDGKMEESSLRVDLNISISDSDILGTRVEVKNMNSFSSVALAIEHEYHRQLSLLNKGDEVIQETRK